MIDNFVRDRLLPPEQQPEFRLLDYPDQLNAAAELLKGGAADALAVINAHGRWTYGFMDDLSGRIARLLVEEEGLVPGNRVLLRGPNGAMMFACWLGILKAGGVAVTTMRWSRFQLSITAPLALVALTMSCLRERSASNSVPSSAADRSGPGRLNLY